MLRRKTTGHLDTGAAPAAPAVIVLLLFFVVPTLLLFSRSLLEPQPGFQNYIELLTSTTYRRVLTNTFVVSTVVTVVTLLIGFPIAWLLAIMPRKWSSIVLGIILLSMWTNLLTRTFAWLVLLQTTGVINRSLMALGVISSPLPLVNNLTGVTIGMTYIMLPFVIMPIYATISALDASVFRAAALCGANRWQSFIHVLLPASLPGIAAGGLMVFVMSLGYFVTPALLGGTNNMMLAEMIAGLIQSLLDWGLGSAAAFILLAITLALFAVQLRFADPFGRSGGTR